MSYKVAVSIAFKPESCNEFLILEVTLEVDLDAVGDVVKLTVEIPSGFIFDSLDSAYADSVIVSI